MRKYLKQTEFWFDIIALCLLWGLIAFIPQDSLNYEGISLVNILKIVALISTLEAVCFFAHHLLGAKSGILIQGLLGGFVSSTMTFLHFTHQSEDSQIHPITVSRALLLSTIGMLMECIFIVFTIVPEKAALLSRPLITQSLVLIIIVAMMGLWKKKAATNFHSHVSMNEPIIWKKVANFSLFILGLIYLMRILSSLLHLPYIWSSFLLSLFEAHGVLTAALTALKDQHETEAIKVVLMVLVGNVISKSFLILRGDNKALRFPVLSALLLSLGLAWLST